MPSLDAATVRRCGAVLIVLLALGVAACSQDGPDRTQPAPNATTFEVGRFDDLPHPPRSEPLGDRSDAGNVVARSYRATGTSPEQVLAFYADALPARGWAATGPVEEPGVGTFRRVWTADGHQLTVSSSSGPTLGQDDGASQVETQYSLSLKLAR